MEKTIIPCISWVKKGYASKNLNINKDYIEKVNELNEKEKIKMDEEIDNEDNSFLIRFTNFF